ncbi:hypothetical protein [Dysgonomonas sp. 25]|uniref:hypothetical protein n=1 Tax=Dysgonomonas sp. 25 TaxID=2302933 RepID=UPI0013D70814|nr:hypothetical protein [Dysgonomonas sp. 25]NDV69978.1 hypothetical protein [Dysgonomonas sp. 25]
MTTSHSNNYYYKSKERLLEEFLEKMNLPEILLKAKKTIEYRCSHPDWDRPIVMYGIRKKHKWIKKNEIAVIIDTMPWQERARMAESHWYTIIYKRPATDLEWHEMKIKNPIKRYWIWSYFINKEWTVEKIISHIVKDDSIEYRLDCKPLVKAFEGFYRRKFSIEII